MAWTFDTIIKLLPTDTGLTLKCQLYNSNGTTNGSEVTTGFTELANGEYHWTNPAMPDGFRGYARFISFTSSSDTYQTSQPLNPEDIEDIALMQGSGFDTSTDSLQAIRDRGDAAWVSSVGDGLAKIAVGTAQAGSSSTITLATGASAVDDYYVGTRIVLTGLTGAEQARDITAYDGTTKIATVHAAWLTNPDATTTYEIQPSSAGGTALNVWDVATAGLTLVGSIGKLLTDESHTVQDIWDAPVANLDTALSIGKQLVDNVDVILSTRSTFDVTSDTVDIGKISGGAGAANNLEAILDDTGGQIKLINAANANALSISSSSAGQRAVRITSSAEFSPAILIETSHAATPGITFSTPDGLGMFGHGIMAALVAGMTEAGSLGKLLADNIPNLDATIATRSTFDNTSDQVIVTTNNDKTGYDLVNVDGLTNTVFREIQLAAIAGKTSIVDNGPDSTMTFKKQDGSTGRFTVTYDATGAWTATAIV